MVNLFEGKIMNGLLGGKVEDPGVKSAYLQILTNIILNVSKVIL